MVLGGRAQELHGACSRMCTRRATLIRFGANFDLCQRGFHVGLLVSLGSTVMYNSFSFGLYCSNTKVMKNSQNSPNFHLFTQGKCLNNPVSAEPCHTQQSQEFVLKEIKKSLYLKIPWAEFFQISIFRESNSIAFFADNCTHCVCSTLLPIFGLVGSYADPGAAKIAEPPCRCS